MTLGSRDDLGCRGDAGHVEGDVRAPHELRLAQLAQALGRRERAEGLLVASDMLAMAAGAWVVVLRRLTRWHAVLVRSIRSARQLASAHDLGRQLASRRSMLPDRSPAA